MMAVARSSMAVPQDLNSVISLAAPRPATTVVVPAKPVAVVPAGSVLVPAQ